MPASRQACPVGLWLATSTSICRRIATICSALCFFLAMLQPPLVPVSLTFPLVQNSPVRSGSAWLWAREDMADTVDVLFVDEAGQMSLANVLALSQAATSIMLLGDPQQLDQPQRGLHPLGAEVSALGHLLNGRATISADQGVFLTETRRLHPDVCAFTSELFYEGRLVSRPENAKQRLNARGLLDGTGLRFAPVEHSGNQNESPEEVERVAASVDHLLRSGATWTNKKGETHALGLQDILIVAPYNAQVSALLERLPAGSRTVNVSATANTASMSCSIRIIVWSRTRSRSSVTTRCVSS